jgi:hypothetical protein
METQKDSQVIELHNFMTISELLQVSGYTKAYRGNTKIAIFYQPDDTNPDNGACLRVISGGTLTPEEVAADDWGIIQ